ncbi:MAG: glycosyltransferase [Acidimicrobiia bacterium]|nr:glycosyltransferase [Acidimicrobiia bacterium]
MADLLSRVTRLVPGPVRKLARRLPVAHRLRQQAYGRPSGPAPTPGTLRPLVYLPTWERWSVMRQRPQEIVAAFAAAGHPAFFVDPTVSTARTESGVTIVPSLRHVPRSGVIAYIHFAPLLRMTDLFEDPAVVYDILDDFSLIEPNEAGLPVEATVAHNHPAAMARADIVMVSAAELEARHAHERPDMIRVDNGVDLDRFRPDGPAETFDGSRPVIGFHGAVSHWFDFDLLAGVATRRPDWFFPVVGPVADEVARRADDLATACPNVAFLGSRPPDGVAEAIRGFDVGVVWFEVTHMTRAVSPLKIYEWLACGVPPVSVPLPSAEAEPLVLIGTGVEGLEASIEKALRRSADWPAASSEAARNAAWQRRIEPVLERLDHLGRRRV